MILRKENNKLNYNINNENISDVIFSIKKELIENKKIIDELLKIDYQYCKIKTELEMLENILEELKNEKTDIQKGQTILINYNGNPCITLNLSVLAVLTQNTIILDYNKNMLGINRFIIETINNTLKNYKTDKLIYLSENYEQKDIDKIICIDNINKYNMYLKEKNTKVKFYSFNYIDFYNDSSEFEEIEELIYKYAENNQIHIESYSELEINEAIQMIVTGLGTNVVVLTNKEKTKEIFKENIKNKKIYINKNPFEQNMKLIDPKILSI